MTDFEKNSTNLIDQLTAPDIILKRIPDVKESFINSLPDTYSTKYDLFWSLGLWVFAIIALLVPVILAYSNTGEFSFLFMSIGAGLAILTILLRYSEKRDNEFQVSLSGIKNWKLNIPWSNVTEMLEVDAVTSRSVSKRYLRIIFKNGERKDLRIKFDDVDRKVLMTIKAFYLKHKVTSAEKE